MSTPVLAEFKKWDTYASSCGRGRITYHPDWSPNQPWASYWRGSAGLHFATVYSASHHFHHKHGVALHRRPPDASPNN